MVPWVYQAEVNSLSMRAKGAAAATSTNWLFGFVCTQFTPPAIASIGYRFYISKNNRQAIVCWIPADTFLHSLRVLQFDIHPDRVLPLPGNCK